jgi:hypothetical protein
MVSICGLAAAATACHDRTNGSGSPVAPSVSAPLQGMSAAPGGRAAAAPATTGRAVALPAPVDPGFDVATLVAFPPRNESFEFRQELERKYRDGLRRTATSTFADVEGDVVWTQEYLRYRTNLCGHQEAVQRVLQQIDGGAAAPVCGDAPAGLVAFPPRDESFAFRQELERKYRDGLQRSPTSTFVDLEGSIVWTQEYLRYRVNACGHALAVARVFQQIDGGPIGPVCAPQPAPDPVTGLWRGTSNYPNAPFTMDLQLAGRRVSGWYQDQKDRGSVDAEYAGGSDIRFHVFFGDTGFFMDGRFEGDNVIRGSFRVAVLGNQRFDFEMRR